MASSKMKISIEHKRNVPTVTLIDGVIYDQTNLAKYLGVDLRTVYKKFVALRNDNVTLVRWIVKKKWLKNQGLRPGTAVYTRDGFFIITKDIIAATGVSTSVAHDRGRSFEAGKSTKAQMLKKIKKKKAAFGSGKANWGKLESRVRNENLEGIPSGTKFDKQMTGRYGGGPQLTNTAGSSAKSR